MSARGDREAEVLELGAAGANRRLARARAEHTKAMADGDRDGRMAAKRRLAEAEAVYAEWQLSGLEETDTKESS